jgi:signal transduction histidine kinase
MPNFYPKQNCECLVSFESDHNAEVESSEHNVDQPTSRQLISAQEKELSYIARELHDNICQKLVMLSFKIAKASRACGSEDTQVQQQLDDVWRQCSELAGDVQALSHQLHPSLLDNLGLVTAVTGICREISEQSGAVVKFVHKDVPASLPREVALSLFRVVQEALHNAVKYSRASWFHVSLEASCGGIELEIQDRGVGFDVTSPASRSGLGLVSMRERVQLLQGTFRIDSSPNAGTRIRARVPLAKGANLLSFTQ